MIQYKTGDEDADDGGHVFQFRVDELKHLQEILYVYIQLNEAHQTTNSDAYRLARKMYGTVQK